MMVNGLGIIIKILGLVVPLLIGVAFLNNYNVYGGQFVVLYYAVGNTSTTGPYTPYIGTGGSLFTIYELSNIPKFSLDQSFVTNENNGGNIIIGSGTTSYDNELQLSLLATYSGNIGINFDSSYTIDSNVSSGYGGGTIMVSAHRVLGNSGANLQSNIFVNSTSLINFGSVTLPFPSAV